MFCQAKRKGGTLSKRSKRFVQDEEEYGEMPPPPDVKPYSPPLFETGGGGGEWRPLVETSTDDYNDEEEDDLMQVVDDERPSRRADAERKKIDLFGKDAVIFFGYSDERKSQPCAFSNEAYNILRNGKMSSIIKRDVVMSSQRDRNRKEMVGLLSSVGASERASRPTYPQIWVDGKYVGGCDDLKAALGPKTAKKYSQDDEVMAMMDDPSSLSDEAIQAVILGMMGQDSIQVAAGTEFEQMIHAFVRH